MLTEETVHSRETNRKRERERKRERDEQVIAETSSTTARVAKSMDE